MINQQMDFHNGYRAAIDEIYHILTTGEGRTEAYEAAVEYCKEVRGGL